MISLFTYSDGVELMENPSEEPVGGINARPSLTSKRDIEENIKSNRCSSSPSNAISDVAEKQCLLS